MLLQVIVTAQNTPSRSLTLPVLRSTPEHPFIAKRIDGLGPVDAEFAYADQAFRDGAVVANSKVGARNLILYLGLNQTHINPEPLESARRDLYRHISPKMQVDLEFRFDVVGGQSLRLKGIIEKMEPGIFQKEFLMQVSILCPQPYYEALSQITVPRTVTGGVQDRPWVSNWGDAPTGFEYECTWTDATTAATLTFGNSNVASDNWSQMTLSRSLLNGTTIPTGSALRFSTVPGNKYLDFKIPGGAWRTALHAIQSGSLNIEVGPHVPGFYESVGSAHTSELRFTPKYTGI